MDVFFSEKKIPDLDILIESKDIIYNQPTIGISELQLKHIHLGTPLITK